MNPAQQLFPCPIKDCCEGMLTAEGLALLLDPVSTERDPIREFGKTLDFEEPSMFSAKAREYRQ